MTNEEIVQLIKTGVDVKENMSLLYTQNRGYIFVLAKPYSSICDIEELMQVAYLGLHEAVENYELNQDYKFITYAALYIRRQLSKYAHSNSYIQTIPSYLVSLMAKYQRYKSEYISTNNREPSKEDYMQSLELTETRYNSLLKAIEKSSCTSMDKVIPGTEGLTLSDTLDDGFLVDCDVVDRLCDKQISDRVWACINNLNTKYRDIIVMKYIEGKSIAAISQHCKVSEYTIKQIEEKAVNRLKRDLSREGVWELLWGK